MGKDGKNAVRVTTTLTKEQYDQLGLLAKKHGVAIAWFVRKAVEKALEEADGGPLLPLV